MTKIINHDVPWDGKRHVRYKDMQSIIPIHELYGAVFMKFGYNKYREPVLVIEKDGKQYAIHVNWDWCGLHDINVSEVIEND